MSYNCLKVVMVMFVGGCTMAEVAALRFLSQQVSHFLLLFFYLSFVISTLFLLDIIPIVTI